MENKYIKIDSDCSYTTYIRIINTIVNRRNTRRLKKFCAIKSRHIHIASDYDCTGLLCAIYYQCAALSDKYIVEVTHCYDY